AYLSDKATWAQSKAPALLQNPVAYFTAEFGFHETLPIAAGGLGILAGDHAKSASDLGLGFVGVSLFYREGYFQQLINQDNWQMDFYTLFKPKKLPIEPVLAPNGEPVPGPAGTGPHPGSFQNSRGTVGRPPLFLTPHTAPL